MTRVRRGAQLALCVLGTVMLAFFARDWMLAGAARVLVHEDPLTPADIIVVSNSTPRAASLEAARLYAQHVSVRVVMARWIKDSLDERIRGLGIPYLDSTELSLAILERSGVPASAITVLPGEVDGTGKEAQAIAAFVDEQSVKSVLVVTARSHTARMKWLLAHKLRGRAVVSVRSPGFDTFSTASWWRERDQSREVVTEYLRWLNTLLLPNLWARAIAHDGGGVA